MAVTHDRVKIKRPLSDTWTTREQLCLASSVLKSGDQNWMSVSRSLKQFIDKDNLKPAEWYSPKSCAQQYSQLLENTDAPKRKKREGGETTSESIIVRRLTQERISELNQMLNAHREEYLRLKAELNVLRSGTIKEEKLQKMWQQIEQEEREQDQRNKIHTAWLAKRQQKKDQLQSPQMVNLNVPRKTCEITTEMQESTDTPGEDEEKKNKGGGRSPLLTSLLKSPSPTTQIQAPISSAQVTSPTIASLLGSSPKVPTSQISQTVSPQLHQLVSSGVSSPSNERPSAGAPTLSMLLEIPTNIQRANLTQTQSQIHSTPTTSLIPPPYSHSTTENPLTIGQTPMTQVTTDNNLPVVQPLDAMQIPSMSNIPVNDSMVQIINQIDNIIPKDIIRNVMDKDEMNEFIGDIEELIKEEITASPQAMDTANRVMDSLNVPQSADIILHNQQTLPKTDVMPITDAPVPVMTSEEIDRNSSNIADIIDTITADVIEPKIIVTDESSTVTESQSEGLQENAETVNTDIAVNLQNEMIQAVDEPCQIKDEPIINEAPESNVENDVIKAKEKDVAEVLPVSDKLEDKSIDESSINDTKEVNIDIKVEDESNVETPLKSETSEQENQVESVVENKCLSDAPDNENIISTDKVTEKEDTVEKQELDKSVDENSKEIEVTIKEKESTKKETIDVATKEVDEVKVEVSTLEEKPKEIPKVEDEVRKVEESIKEEKIAVPDSASQEDKTEQQVEIKTEEVKKPEELTETLPEVQSESIPQKETHTTEVSDNTAVNVPINTEEVKKESTDSTKNNKVEDKKVSKELSQPKDDVKEEIKVKEIKKEEEPVTKREEEEKAESEEEEEELKPVLEVKKENVESGEDAGEFYDEEPSISKINTGKAVKTYSKKQTVVDSEPEIEGNEGADYRTWKKAVMLVYNRLATHKYASLFLRPITEEQAPGYHSVIFRPMDLSTIKKNIENGTIRTTNHFKRDVMLMFQNALMYNKQNTVIYQMAVSMQEECLEQMQILVQVTVQASFRRETRTAANTSSDSIEIGMKRKRSLITPSPNETDSPRTKKYKKFEND